MLRNFRVALLCFALLNPLPIFAQGTATAPAQTAGADADIQAKIRKEGMDNSQIMRTMHYFTDVYGPRLTGSPNHENAAKWAVKQMTEWGFANAHLEPWDFGHMGWLNERATAHILSPFKEPLVVEVLGWTPSTSFDELVAEMVREDLKSAERDELVKKHGYEAMDRHE